MLPTAPPIEGDDWPSTPPVPWQDLRGRVVVVVFWSLACEASLLTLRRLSDMADGWDRRGPGHRDDEGGHEPDPDRAEMDQAGMDPTGMNPTGMNPTEMNPTEVNQAEMDPTGMNPTEVNQAEMDPTEMNPTEVNPTEMNPTEMNPTEVNQAEMDPTGMNQAEMDPTEVNQAGPVVVLAVHTPRFPFEDDRDLIEAAILRHRITFPVVHDPMYLNWNRYNPEGWPAVAVVDRRGKVVGMHAGPNGLDLVAEVVEEELTRPGGRSGDDPPPLVMPTPVVTDAETMLSFPSGLTVTPSGHLVVADTGNDRLLVGPMDHDLRTFQPEFEITDIDRPTAVVCARDSLFYLIESGRGSILRLDLEEGSLEEMVDDLAAPQDLTFDLDGSLVVADAGSERLVRIIPDGPSIIDIGRGPEDDRPLSRECLISGTIAGSGFTGCRDGGAAEAELAQPVAVARTGAGIAFADAASSNIRVLTDDGRVHTVTGSGFFEWGLVDGPAHKARLQRPSGLCALVDGSLIIADTGNGRIRLLADRRIRTLGLAGLRHPTAIRPLPGGHLLIADTGNHRLVVADPELRTAWPLAVYPAEMTSNWEAALPHAIE